MSAEEIASLDLSACELAVLSACETNHRASSDVPARGAGVFEAGGGLEEKAFLVVEAMRGAWPARARLAPRIEGDETTESLHGETARAAAEVARLTHGSGGRDPGWLEDVWKGGVDSALDARPLSLSVGYAREPTGASRGPG